MSHTGKQEDPVNAWMATTFIFAALLVLSLVWNGVLTFMFIQGGSTGTVVVDQPTQAAPSPSPSQNPGAAPAVAVSADDDPFIGDENAKVEIIEFSDFECPFCGRFHSDSYTQIKKDYIDTGKVKFVFRDYPLSFHQRAVPAAIAAECVDELSDDETFFEYHSVLFDNQNDLSDAALEGYAVELGIDGDDFSECFADTDGSIAAEINKDFKDGQAAGVSGTPTLFINGKKIVGAQPYNVFKAAIDAELA